MRIIIIIYIYIYYIIVVVVEVVVIFVVVVRRFVYNFDLPIYLIRYISTIYYYI